MTTENKAYINPKSGKLTTAKGRILWNSLFKPRKGRNGKEGKYEFNLLFPKTADLALLKEAAVDAGKDKFSKAFKDAGGKWPSGVKSPFKKTAENDKLADLADDYPVYLAFRTSDMPGVVGPNGKSEGIGPEDVYPGRWARATCDAYAYDTDGNKGVTFGLGNVQLLDNDEELVIGGGRVSAESEFEAADGAGDAGGSTDSLFD